MYLSKPNVPIIRDSKICHPPYHVSFYAVKPVSPTHAGLNVHLTRMCNVKPHPLKGAGQCVVLTRLIGLNKVRLLVHAYLRSVNVVNCVYKYLLGPCILSSSTINLQVFTSSRHCPANLRWPFGVTRCISVNQQHIKMYQELFAYDISIKH